MKHVLLIRHAKSSWSTPGLSDYERPLNDRGKNDAPKMANRLLKRNYPIDLFISSPAERAAKTTLTFAEAYQFDKTDILFVPSLYHASPDTYFEVIQSVDNKYDHIAIISHNNGLTDFANMLTKVKINNMPTCSVFAIKVDTDRWSEIKIADKDFDFFDFPKSDKD